MMLAGDRLHRFLIEHTDVRGEWVHLDATWQALLERRDYPAPVQQILGEALAAVALLASTIKYYGSLILQVKGAGPLHMLVVQVRGNFRLRGLARWNGQVPAGTLREVFGASQMVITIDPGQGKERYQGVVELVGNSLGEALEHYFARSEQLPTRLWLAADGKRAAGLLLQKMPGATSDTDAWPRAVHLAETVTRMELLSLSAKQLLRRLYAAEDVRLLEAQPVSFRCGCGRARVGEVIRHLGLQEARNIIDEEGSVRVCCEFCNAEYEFDSVDIEELFAVSYRPPVTKTPH